MGRKHSKVINHRAVSKRMRLTEAQTYDAMERAKDVLWHIHIGNSSWGNEWYECVRFGCFESALRIVEQRGKGDSFIDAISALNELIMLNKHMKEF